MEKERPYEKMNYNNNNNNLQKLNKIEEHKNWIFENYIDNHKGLNYMNKGNLFPAFQNSGNNNYYLILIEERKKFKKVKKKKNIGEIY